MGKPSKRSGRAKEARKVERSDELRRGDDGCENQKIKEVSPCPLEESRVVDVRLDVNYGMNPLMGRTSGCLVTQNDRNVGPYPPPSSEPIERHQSNISYTHPIPYPHPDLLPSSSPSPSTLFGSGLYITLHSLVINLRRERRPSRRHRHRPLQSPPRHPFRVEKKHSPEEIFLLVLQRDVVGPTTEDQEKRPKRTCPGHFVPEHRVTNVTFPTSSQWPCRSVSRESAYIE